MKRAEWKAAATDAATAAVSERLRSVTSVWAEARQSYLTLWDECPTDVAALGRAIRRFEELDKLRRSLASQLRSTT